MMAMIMNYLNYYLNLLFHISTVQGVLAFKEAGAGGLWAQYALNT